MKTTRGESTVPNGPEAEKEIAEMIEIIAEAVVDPLQLLESHSIVIFATKKATPKNIVMN